MQLQINKSTLQNFQEAIQYEWLETNGLGGFSSSSIIHANTRCYHGLLVAATTPPAERTVLLSKLDETIVLNDKRIELGANLYGGDVVHPEGNQYLKSFSKELFSEWVYEAEGVQLKKNIAMLHGENTVVVLYEVVKANKKFTLDLLPLMAGRFYHSLEKEGPQMHWDVDFKDGVFHNRPDGNLNVYINVPGSAYAHSPRWFNNFKYSVEEYRGLNCTEDLFNHGVFSIELEEGDSLGIIISDENPVGRNAKELMLKEVKRRKALLNGQPDDETLHQLILAADQFIVKREIAQAASPEVSPFGGDLAGATVIAGYHWFTDWGRDTMISLPGLCLSTGRFEDAKKILYAFAKSVSMGMLPNRFQDNNEPPEYNNVDGTLWYFVAVYKYLQASNDKKFVLNEILPVLQEMIDWHFKGTRYNIHVDDDGLLYAGEDGQQLTWMDARIGNWVVTPRMGKPVEIQALWYNALKIFAELLRLNKQKAAAEKIVLNAAKAKESFDKLFWYEEGSYLYDVIDEHANPDAALRPNQLFAISLPFALLEGDKAKSVLQVIANKLYTPVGLKTLPAEDKNYIHQYGGDQWHRDSSYHQGTVWSWLLGAYVDAIIKVNGAKGKLQAQKIINDFKFHLNEGCIGSISEIFDADAPHHSRGCIAQAWGVAEVLRVMKEYELYKIPPSKTKK